MPSKLLWNSTIFFLYLFSTSSLGYKSKFNKRVLDLYNKNKIDELTKSKYRMHEQRAKYDKNIKLDESAKEKLVSVYATQERSLVNEEARLDFIEKDDKLHDEYIENIIKR